MAAEDIRSSFLATTVHLQETPELLSRDHDAAQAVSDGLRDTRAPTPAASIKPHGTSSASRPSSLAGNHCRPNPRQSPSTSATWPWKTTRHQMMASFTEKPTEDPPRPITDNPSSPPSRGD